MTAQRGRQVFVPGVEQVCGAMRFRKSTGDHSFLRRGDPLERQIEGRPRAYGVPGLGIGQDAAGKRRGRVARQPFSLQQCVSKLPDAEEPEDGGADVPEMPDMAFDPVAAALRQMHERVVAEPIPEDFLRLLDQLDDSDGGDGSDDGGKAA